MSTTTPNFAIPKPQGTDPADGPGAIGAVADRLEAIHSSGLRSSGKSIIAASQSTSSATYTLLGTPDRVQNIVLPTDGLIAVLFQAVWQESVAQAAEAAIFIGANQLVVAADHAGVAGNPSTRQQSAKTRVTAATAKDMPLASFPGGLATVAHSGPGAVGNYAHVTTGQVVGVHGEGDGSLDYALDGSPVWDSQTMFLGGPCYVFAAAGTYDVSVQFRASSGAVTAQQRKLWVWSMGMGLP